MNPDHFTDVTKAIQLAPGPVFLLTGIAGMLNDGRSLVAHHRSGPHPARAYRHQRERPYRGARTARAGDTSSFHQRGDYRLHGGGVAGLPGNCHPFLEAMLTYAVEMAGWKPFMASTLALVVGLAFSARGAPGHTNHTHPQSGKAT